MFKFAFSFSNLGNYSQYLVLEIYYNYVAQFPFVDWVELLEACHSMSNLNSPQEKSVKRVVMHSCEIKTAWSTLSVSINETLQTGSFCRNNVNRTLM